MATTIRGLRILPPYVIARFGSSPTPLEAYNLQLPDDKNPVGYRQIVAKDTFKVDPKSGEIVEKYCPESIRFVDRDGQHYHIRPVCPFLEVFAETADETLVPLTRDLLNKLGLEPKDVEWRVDVANLKAFRQTGAKADKVTASVKFNDHDVHHLEGNCKNFRDKKLIPFGNVRYIRPTTKFPEIRLRFTPAKGLVYGAHQKRFTAVQDAAKGKYKLIDDKDDDPIFCGHEERIVYDPKKGGWRGFQFTANQAAVMPNPNDIYEGLDSAVEGEARFSWGYLDDVCDGPVTVTLRPKTGSALEARAWISACMPVFAPDSLPLRTVADELEQLVLGPEIAKDEISVEEAARIVWRALETVRFMNMRVMNGNAIDGRENVASTLVRQDTNDFGRLFAPTFASSIVDNLAVRVLHERVITALRSGCAPWFTQVLRRPEEIGELTDKDRRKMPAMLRGADSRALTLTRRQISVITKAALLGPFAPDPPGK